jgi:hypothetical protein
MTLAHAGYLVPRKNATDRQTDTDGPIKCSSLTLECEDRLTTQKTTIQMIIYLFKTKDQLNSYYKVTFLILSFQNNIYGSMKVFVLMFNDTINLPT